MKFLTAMGVSVILLLGKINDLLKKDDFVSCGHASCEQLRRALPEQVRSQAVLLSTGNVAMISEAQMQFLKMGRLCVMGKCHQGPKTSGGVSGNPEFHKCWTVKR